MIFNAQLLRNDATISGGHTPRQSHLVHWLFHALCMVALGGVIGWQLYVEYVRIDYSERELLLNHAQMIARNLSMELDATRQALLGIRTDPAYWTQVVATEPASQRLKILADAMPGVRTILVLDANGVVITSNRGDLVGRDFSNREYFVDTRRISSPVSVIVSPPFKTALGVWSMNLAMMIVGERGEFAGVIAATLDPDYFTTLLGSTLYAPDMWSAIVHGDGLQFLTVPDREDQRGKNLALPGTLFTRHIESGQTETVVKGMVYGIGQYRYLAQITINPPSMFMNRPLVAAINHDVEAAYAIFYKDARTQTVMFSILLIVSTVGLYFFQRHQRAFDRRVAEARIQAERASAAKSYFLANMGHELRTPLNSIIGFSQLIRDKAYGPQAKECIEAADDIHLAGTNLLTLISDILNVSKIEAGKMEIEQTNLPLASIIYDASRIFRLKAETRQVTLSIIVAEPGLSIWADERALRHILFNLMSNAIKFTPAGGSVSVIARKADDGGVLLSVSDTGIGIPADDITRIVKPFEQIDNRFSRAHGGTGLGLPLVQGLVTLHGGRLEIQSEPGNGSTFTVWLPPAPSN